MKEKNNVKLYVIVGVLFGMIAIYVIARYSIKSQYTPNYLLEDFYVMPERVLGVNEYSVSRVTNEDMAKTYFNLFASMMLFNTDKSYEYLNPTYRENNYPTLDSYRNKVALLTDNFTKQPQIDSYNYVEKDNVMRYIVVDKNGNRYRFDATAVMKYTVYFEEG